MSALNIVINLIGNNLAGGAFGTLASDINQVSYAARALGIHMGGVSNNTAKAAAGAAGAGILFGFFAGAVVDGVTGAADLEQKLLEVKQAAQASGDAMPFLTTAINDLAVRTVYGSGEAADAFAQLIRSGFSVSQVMYGAGAAAGEYKAHAYDAAEASHGLGFEALALGQALHISAADGATLASSALHTFGQEIKNSANPTKAASDIVNELAGAFLNGAQNGQDLLSFLQQVGPTAASMGVNFKDLVTTGDVLAQSMGSMGMAGTRLRYMLQTLIHPTAAQQKELASLGLESVNNTSKFKAFEGQLVKTGGASEANIKQWSGSVTGLKNMFTAAQGVGLIPLDTTFGDWAVQNGYLNNKLYDSHGAFKGTASAVDALYQALKNKTPEERMAALSSMFNVRGGDAGRILASLTDFDKQYHAIFDRIGKTDAVTMAMQQLDTLKGSVQALGDSFTSGLAVAFLQLLPYITRFTGFLNTLLEKFLSAPPAVQTAVGVFLILGAVLSGLAVIVLGGMVVFALLAPIFAGIGVGLGGLVAIFLGVPAVILAVTAVFTALWVWLNSGTPVLGQLQRLWKDLSEMAMTIWVIIRANLLPVFQQLWAQIHGPLLAVWAQLSAAFVQLRPYLILAAEFFGVTLVVSIGLFITILVAVVTALATFISGLIEFVTGIVEIVVGVIATILDSWNGLFNILSDLFTGNMTKLSKDWTTWLNNLKTDGANITQGMWTSIQGIWNMSIGAIVAGVKSFYDAAVGIFTTLADVLVGHSIVPDMVNAIVRWFSQLPARVGAAVQSLLRAVVSGIGSMASSAISAVQSLVAKLPTIVTSVAGQMANAGRNIIQGLIGGLKSMGGSLTGTLGTMVSGAVNSAKNALGIKSPSTVFHELGVYTMQGFANGVTASQGLAHAAVTGAVLGGVNAAASAALPLSGIAAALSGASARAGSGAEQPITIYLDNTQRNQLGKWVFNRATGALKQSGVSRMGR